MKYTIQRVLQVASNRCKRFLRFMRKAYYLWHYERRKGTHLFQSSIDFRRKVFVEAMDSLVNLSKCSRTSIYMGPRYNGDGIQYMYNFSQKKHLIECVAKVSALDNELQIMGVPGREHVRSALLLLTKNCPDDLLSDKENPLLIMSNWHRAWFELDKVIRWNSRWPHSDNISQPGPINYYFLQPLFSEEALRGH